MQLVFKQKWQIINFYKYLTYRIYSLKPDILGLINNTDEVRTSDIDINIFLFQLFSKSY